MSGFASIEEQAGAQAGREDAPVLNVMDQELQQREASKLQGLGSGLEGCRAWIEAVVGEPFSDDDFATALKDGVMICKLINKIKPKSVKKINSSKLAFKQMENISKFTKACKELGVPAGAIFDTNDLYEGKNVSAVFGGLEALGTAAQLVEGFEGPHFGPAPVRGANKGPSKFKIGKNSGISKMSKL